jgi:hypothetical protein
MSNIIHQGGKINFMLIRMLVFSIIYTSTLLSQENSQINLELYFQNSFYQHTIEIYLTNSEANEKLVKSINFNDSSYHALEMFTLQILRSEFNIVKVKIPDLEVEKDLFLKTTDTIFHIEPFLKSDGDIEFYISDTILEFD